MVFAITLALTTNEVNAKAYVSDDSTTVSSQYHEVFKNYFSEDLKYIYFPYSCSFGNYSRTCYFGIDEYGNYLNISYASSGNSYELKYTSGIDEDFSVTGSNIFTHKPSMATISAYALIFVFLVVLLQFLF